MNEQWEPLVIKIFLNDKRGAAIIEYAMTALLFGVACIAAIATLVSR